jgi:hypothetical protein
VQTFAQPLALSIRAKSQMLNHSNFVTCFKDMYDNPVLANIHCRRSSSKSLTGGLPGSVMPGEINLFVPSDIASAVK